MSLRNKREQKGKAIFPLLVVVLWLSSVGSAMGVVYSTYESRKATQQLEELRREAAGLQVVSGQLLLERSSWSAYSRVEKVALEELNMMIPAVEKTVLVVKK